MNFTQFYRQEAETSRKLVLNVLDAEYKMELCTENENSERKNVAFEGNKTKDGVNPAPVGISSLLQQLEPTNQVQFGRPSHDLLSS